MHTKIQLNTEATSKHNIGSFYWSFVVHTCLQIKHEKTQLIRIRILHGL